MADDIIFLKLGGSLITNKLAVESLRQDVLEQIAAEIAVARQETPSMNLVLGHGSGSFGHVVAAKHNTRAGVKTAEEWRGFIEVSDAALRLNRRVAAALLDAGVPVISLSPAASAECDEGVLQQLATTPIRAALAAELVPLIYGDVAFDAVLGGTIISTEEIMIYLVDHLRPRWLLLAGETEGVYDEGEALLKTITPENFEAIRPTLGGSRGTDVTGGMSSKVTGMLDVVREHAQLTVKIFSGLQSGNIQRLLAKPETEMGTMIYNPSMV